MTDYMAFSSWLNKVLEKKLPDGIIAFNFNLYEGSESTYDIQLIGSDEFDENDQDWACTDYFTTGEDIFYISRSTEIELWEQGLIYITGLITQYLVQGEKANVLKDSSAIGVGFVDGDIEIIYRK